MPQVRIAKLFKNGASQAVRLPAAFRFKGKQVYATRDERTGDVVLSDAPGEKAWDEFFKLVRSCDIPEDFMSSRPMNVPARDRSLFPEEER